MASRWYPGGCCWKNSQAALSALNCFASAAANWRGAFSNDLHDRTSTLLFQNLADGFDGVPIAGSGGDAEMFLNGSIGIRLAQPSDAQGESAGDGNDRDLPLGAGGLLDRKAWFRAGRFLQNTHESARVPSSGSITKPISARQLEHFAGGTNHQFGLEPQPAQNFVAQFRLAHILAHDERSRRADVNDTELGQFLGQFAGLKRLMS